MKILQYNCREEKGIDLRQANAVLRHRPDIIIDEAPSGEGRTAQLGYNPNDSIKKQESKLKKLTKDMRKIAPKFPWVMSDIPKRKNVIKLQKIGHKTKIYAVDGPRKLLRESIKRKWDLIDKPRRRGIHLLWWTYIYLRERIMANKIEPLLKNKNQTVLISMQKFHWLNVKFLLSKPTKDEIWENYFGRFKNVNKKNISEIIKTKNKVLYKYWLKNSDFT
ncbi:MAG: hypothetical protein WC609_00955 [Candidatus Paceibacterota bacterium]|jgi:hypothetical protein